MVLYAKDVLTDLVTIHHGQPRWQYCTQVSSTLFGEAIARLFLASMSSISRANIDKEVSEHISKFFPRNSTLHFIAICRFNKQVKECLA